MFINEISLHLNFISLAINFHKYPQFSSESMQVNNDKKTERKRIKKKEEKDSGMKEESGKTGNL